MADPRWLEVDTILIHRIPATDIVKRVVKTLSIEVQRLLSETTNNVMELAPAPVARILTSDQYWVKPFFFASNGLQQD